MRITRKTKGAKMKIKRERLLVILEPLKRRRREETRKRRLKLNK